MTIYKFGKTTSNRIRGTAETDNTTLTLQTRQVLNRVAKKKPKSSEM